MISLNEEQLKAVQHPVDHPAVLIAGAGSGKSRCLQGRILHLIEQGVPPHRILAITFTNKAAKSLSNRVMSQMGESASNIPRVSTIHSLSLSAIRKNPQGFDLQDKVTPLDDYYQGEMLKDILKTMQSEVNPWGFKEKVSYHRARGIGFMIDYTKEVHEVALKSHSGYHALDDEMLEIWKRYESEKKRRNCLDFDDMLHLTVRRGRSDQAWLDALQRKFWHVLVDEGQDCNSVQYAFINMLLAPSNSNLYIVGDLSQSIYAFCGAAPELLYEYSQNWRGLKPTLYRLEQNYRSVPEVVRMANVIQTKMTETIPLTMRSARGEKKETGTTRLLKACLPRDLAHSIANEIWHQNSLKKSDIRYKDNCILVRSASQIRDLESELIKYRIPYIIRGGKGFLQSEEVRDLLAYLRTVTNPKDLMALSRSIAVPKRGIGDAAIDKIKKVADDKYAGNLIDSMEELKLSKLGIYLNILKEVGKQETPVTALECLLKKTNYLEHIKAKYKKERDKVETKLENIGKLMELFESLNTTKLDDLIFQLTMGGTEDENDENGKVVISTCHSAKGLEWRKVFIFGVVETILPHKFSMGSLKEVEEERRLWYVAVTRAMDHLVICIPAMVQLGPNTMSVAPSRFLFEIGVLQ